MTAPPAGALEACLALLEKATPGEWRWSPNGNIVPAHYTDDCEIATVYFEHMDDVDGPDNAAAIVAAVNLLKDHGPALATALRLREGCVELVEEIRATANEDDAKARERNNNQWFRGSANANRICADDLARILENER